MRIAILCSSGFSTSILLKNLQEAITQEQVSYEIEAYAVCEAVQAGNACDMILLSPQVRFNLEKIKQLFPEKTIALISQKDFEQADGRAILAQIQKLHATKENR